MNTLLAVAVLVSSLWPPRIEQWRPIIEDVSSETDLDPSLIAAVIRWESDGQADAVRYEPYFDVYSVGLMQIVTFDWRRLTIDQLLDPRFNVRTGSYILKTTLDKLAHGNLRLALALYNCGDGVYDNLCGKWGGYVYADKVIKTCREYGGCDVRPRRDIR